MTLINLAIVGVLVFIGYRLILIFVEAARAGWKQAELLEKEFGFDIMAAARHQLGMAKGEKRE